MDEYQQPEKTDFYNDFVWEPLPASTGKRMANYFIDLFGFSVFFYFFSFLLVYLNYDLVVLIYSNPEDESSLLAQFILLVFYGMYMGLVEALFNGRSLGKLITGTVAVNEDGSRIHGDKALWRGLCRAVPFSVFSALGVPCRPWHDRWTKSYVINLKDLPPQ